MATIPEITDRLESATEKAENASQIIYDVANGDATTEVPTASGPTPTLKKWFQDLGSEVEPMLAGIPARLDKALLVYADRPEANAASISLPDGQLVEITSDSDFNNNNTLNYVLSGSLVFIKYSQEFVVFGGADPVTIQDQLSGMNPEAPLFRGFWTDDPTGANIHRFSDRSFFAGAVKNTGRRTAPLGGTWLTLYGANYFEKNSYNIILSEEDRGKCPLLVGCYTGPDETVSNYNMGFGAVSVNRGQGTYGRAGYFEAMHFSTTGATGAIEVQVGNYTGVSNIANPYSPVGNADGIAVGAESGHLYTVGDDNTPITTPTVPAGAAYSVRSGSIGAAYQRFRTGMLFVHNSLFRGTDGVNGNATAIWMAQGHEIKWAAASSILGATVRSDVNATASQDVGIVFKNNAVHVTGTGEVPLGIFSRDTAGAGGVNYFNLRNARTNTAPTLAAAGADANIGIALQGKGTGVLRFLTQDGASEHIRVNAIANAVNYLSMNGQAVGANPRITAAGSDPNIDLELGGKGSGLVKFTYNSTSASNSSSFSATRMIAVKDSSGATFYVAASSNPW